MRVRSKLHSLVNLDFDVASVDLALLSGCSNIYPMPVLLQSIFKNIGLVESYCFKSGDEVMETFRSL